MDVVRADVGEEEEEADEVGDDAAIGQVLSAMRRKLGSKAPVHPFG